MDVKFITCFFCIYWDDHKIFILYFAMWCIKLTDLQMLNHPCTPRIDPIWSQYTILSMYCWIWFADILLRNFASVHQGYWPVIFFSCGFLIWFWYQGNAGLVKWVWRSSLLCYFGVNFRIIGTNYFLNIWCNSPVKPLALAIGMSCLLECFWLLAQSPY